MENHKKMWEIVILPDRCIIKKMISKKNVNASLKGFKGKQQRYSYFMGVVRLAQISPDFCGVFVGVENSLELKIR